MPGKPGPRLNVTLPHPSRETSSAPSLRQRPASASLPNPPSVKTFRGRGRVSWRSAATVRRVPGW
ncbi:MAG: hypothetical protein IT574_08035 [Candidatus Aureabacteria bacterium]|nr:hypothetical protein [Candidatus Auribacterota bacterium]